MCFIKVNTYQSFIAYWLFKNNHFIITYRSSIRPGSVEKGTSSSNFKWIFSRQGVKKAQTGQNKSFRKEHVSTTWQLVLIWNGFFCSPVLKWIYNVRFFLSRLLATLFPPRTDLASHNFLLSRGNSYREKWLSLQTFCLLVLLIHFYATSHLVILFYAISSRKERKKQCT